MNKIFGGLIKGLAIGLIIGFFLSGLVGCEATANCVEEWIGAFFGCGSCSEGCSDYLGDEDVQRCYLYSSLISAVIGGVYGTLKAIQDKDNDQKKRSEAELAAEKQQRIQWASEIKQKANSVASTCSQNEHRNKSSIVTTSYKADSMMEQIVMEIARVNELEGKINAMAADIAKGEEHLK